MLAVSCSHKPLEEWPPEDPQISNNSLFQVSLSRLTVVTEAWNVDLITDNLRCGENPSSPQNRALLTSQPDPVPSHV